MRFTRVFFILLALFAFAAHAAAGEAQRVVKVANAWVRAPAPGQNTAAGYLELTSDRDAALIGASSPAAGGVEMHTSSVEGGVMRMRAVPRIELPAGKTVKLAPGGNHLMLVGLKQPLKPGQKIALTLSTEPRGAGAEMSVSTVAFYAEVRAPDGAAPHKH